MSTIHQIYCTHCSYGSSALERREGGLAGRTVGYSARAGSLAGPELRKLYRQIERSVYYYLPRDTPAEVKLQLTAAAAPRRLIYLPSTGGLQVIGQICYRPRDTEGRPGSYFAHLLLRTRQDGQPTWSPGDCLRLWRAPGWVQEDSPHIPFLTPALNSLSEMLGTTRPAIDDAVLTSFLTAPAGGPFDDPADVIPARWQNADADRRRTLFTESFSGFMAAAGQRRRSVLVVIEPGLAALVFYGILRLLPPGPFRDETSFSTFEPSPERLSTLLSATIFYNPASTDIRPETYRAGGYVLNTFSNRASEIRAPQAFYAQAMVNLLVQQGWDAVDRRLGNLELVGARQCPDLGGMAAVDRLVSSLFDPESPPPNQDWRRSPMAANYLRQELATRLSRLDDPAARLNTVVGRPAQLIILEMLAGNPIDPAVRAAVDYLLRTLPENLISQLLHLEGVPPEVKIRVLLGYVTEKFRLPPDCGHLCGEPLQQIGTATSSAPSLLTQILSRLDPATLEKFYRSMPEGDTDGFFKGLLDTGLRAGASPLALTQIMRVATDNALLSLADRIGTGWVKEYPGDEPALGQKLQGMLRALCDHPEEFSRRLDLILAAEHLLPEDRDLELAAAWRRCRRAMLELGELQEQKSGVLRSPPVEVMDKACCQMAQAATQALPEDRFGHDPHGIRRKDCLVRIGKGVLGGKSLLPRGVRQHDALWQKVAWSFETGSWTRSPLRRIVPRSTPTRWLLLLLAVPVLVVVAVAYSRWNAPTASSGAIAQARATSEADSSAGPKRGEDPDQPSDRTQVDQRRVHSKTTAHAYGDLRPKRAPGPETDNGVSPGRPKASSSEAKEDVEPSAKRPVADNLKAVQPPGGFEIEGRAAGRELTHISDQQERAIPGPTEVRAADGLPWSGAEWKARAQEFADRHGGLLLDRAAMRDAVAEIPWQTISFDSARPQLVLGPGRLVLDTGSYRFGGHFDTQSLAIRHEIPRLAVEMALERVYVELRIAGSTPTVVVQGEGEGVQPATEPSPENGEPRDWTPRAENESTRIEPLGWPSAADLLAENEDLIADLKTRCRQISVVVLPQSEAAADQGRTTSHPDVAISSDPNVSSGSPSELPVLEGTFRQQDRRVGSLRPPAVARIEPSVSGPRGRRWPSWCQDNIVVGCVLAFEQQTGERRTVHLQDIDVARRAPVLRGTVQVRCQFTFSVRRLDDPLQLDSIRVAASSWHQVDPLVPDMDHVVRFEIAEDGLDRLQALGQAQPPGS